MVGVDPGTGKDIRRSVYAPTQREARRKMTEAIAALDRGIYRDPCRMTLGQWPDIWTAEYLNSIKPRTLEAYLSIIKTHIRPGLGAVRLEQLNAHTIQKFYNSLDGLSPKTVKNVHGVLHKALQQAAAIGYMTANPADACSLPRAEKPELHPLDEDDTGLFIEAVKGHRYEAVFLFTLFTGARQGEVLGLTWDCVDFTTGTVTINKQLQKAPRGSEYSLVSPKNSKGRTIFPAPYVMRLLKEQHQRQAEWQLRVGPAWEGSGLVFTDELGRHLMPHTVYHAFKKVVASIGLPDVRFHDLRHSYAVASIRAGDDIKTVQGNLGHATTSFTLDVYGHVTEQMKQASAERMERYIEAIMSR